MFYAVLGFAAMADEWDSDYYYYVFVAEHLCDSRYCYRIDVAAAESGDSINDSVPLGYGTFGYYSYC